MSTTTPVTPPQPQYVAAPKNSLATAGMVLGIVFLVLSLIPVLGAVAIVGGLLAVVLAAVGFARSKKLAGAGRGKAIAGLATGILSVIIAGVMLAAVDNAVDEINADIDNATDTSASTDITEDEVAKDLVLGEIHTDAYSTKVDVTVTNSTSEPKNYFATVAVESTDGATQYGTGNLFVQDLAPGQTTTESVLILEDVPANTEIQARLTDATRVNF